MILALMTITEEYYQNIEYCEVMFKIKMLSILIWLYDFAPLGIGAENIEKRKKASFTPDFCV